MAILIILLVINIVASSIFGESISFKINLCLLDDDSFNLLLWEGESEKKAISEPDTRPDPINKKIQDIKGVKNW